MKWLKCLCRFYIVRFFGFGMKVRPLRNTFFVFQIGFFVTKITNALSAVCGWLLNDFWLGGSGLELVVGVWLGCGLLLSNIMLFGKSCV